METISMDTQVLSEVPPELKTLYDQLYVKISSLIAGNVSFDIKKDPTVLRIMIQSVMTIVENFKDVDGKGWNGQEKQRIALNLIKFVLNDLAVKGKLDPAVAKEVITELDFWGGLAMGLVIDAVKGMYDVGQQFSQDVQKVGCKAACKKNCFSCC
jgi:hypothetical protein